MTTLTGSHRVAVHAVLACALALFTGAAGTTAGEDDSALEERGVALYDAGDFEGALPYFEELAARDSASGSILYRLAYSMDRLGDGARAQDVQTRALEALRSEFEKTPTLENAFYLVNTYSNLKRIPEAKATAAKATAWIESGKGPRPVSGPDLFRVAKLYSDQGDEETAIARFRDAVKALSADPARNPAYIGWARRYIADRALARSDYEAAEAEISALIELEGGSPDSYDRLAVVRARGGRWSEASSAWKEAEKLDPARADRFRYCSRIVLLAKGLGELPPAGPSGKPFTEMSREELEEIMSSRAGTVRDVMVEVEESESTTPEQRAELQAKVDEARGAFTSAALEYALRKLPIRETAFFGGYAPLIFHESRWKVPGEETGKRGRGRRR